MTVRRLFFILGSIALLIIGFVLIKKFISCSAYQCLVFPGKESWHTREVYEETQTGWRGLITDSRFLVRLEEVNSVDAKDAGELTKITTMKLLGLFDSARSPYPGAITNEVVCQDQFKPKGGVFTNNKNIDVSFYTAYLDGRMQYGSCVEDQVSYRGSLGIFYCPNVREWYEIELLVPKGQKEPSDGYKSLFYAVHCQNHGGLSGLTF